MQLSNLQGKSSVIHFVSAGSVKGGLNYVYKEPRAGTWMAGESHLTPFLYQ